MQRIFLKYAKYRLNKIKTYRFLHFFSYLCISNFKHMAAKKVLFINQEIIPYVPESELSLMGKELPQAIRKRDTK